MHAACSIAVPSRARVNTYLVFDSKQFCLCFFESSKLLIAQLLVPGMHLVNRSDRTN